MAIERYEILRFTKRIKEFIEIGLDNDEKSNYTIFIDEYPDYENRQTIITRYVTKYTHDKIKNINGQTNKTYDYYFDNHISFDMNTKYNQYVAFKESGVYESEALKKVAEEMIQDIEKCDGKPQPHKQRQISDNEELEKQVKECRLFCNKSCSYHGLCKNSIKTCILIVFAAIGIKAAKWISKICKNR